MYSYNISHLKLHSKQFICACIVHNCIVYEDVIIPSCSSLLLAWLDLYVVPWLVKRYRDIEAKNSCNHCMILVWEICMGNVLYRMVCYVRFYCVTFGEWHIVFITAMN